MLMTKESEQKDGNSWGTLNDEQTRENELSQLPKKEEQNRKKGSRQPGLSRAERSRKNSKTRTYTHTQRERERERKKERER